MDKIVTIERLAFGGEGVGRVDGKVVFVPLTVPGDRVKVRIVSDHRRYERGELIEVLTASQDRTTPRCAVFGQCGGCQWQHISYAKQLVAKEEILRDTLQRLAQCDGFELLPIIPSEPVWNYRNRIQLKNNGRQIGFYGSGNHRIIPFDHCDIAHPSLNKELKTLQQEPQKLGEKFELWVNAQGHTEYLNLPDGERTFSQVNPAQNERMKQELLHFVFGRANAVFTRKKNIVELYAGSGNLTFSLAERAGQVVAVEENQAAIEQLEADCLEQKLHNVECVPGTAEWGLKKIYRRRTSIDDLVIDPPRGGAKDILDLILIAKPRRVIYISCDPSTLARDIKVLSRDYRLEKVQPIDMFPQTYHIESISELVRRV